MKLEGVDGDYLSVIDLRSLARTLLKIQLRRDYPRSSFSGKASLGTNSETISAGSRNRLIGDFDGSILVTTW